MSGDKLCRKSCAACTVTPSLLERNYFPLFFCFCVKVWFDAEILSVHQLVKEDGHYFAFGEFRTHFSIIVITIGVSLCGGVIHAIK